MTSVDGIEAATLPADDRGLQYGDGLFETMRIAQGGVPLLERHLARLGDGCARLGLPLPDAAALRGELGAACAGVAAGVLKLVLTRGSGERGYRPPQRPAPRRILSLHPSPAVEADAAARGVRARSCTTRLAIGGPLAGLKHLNRLEQVLARAEWRDPGIAEGLMLDAEGTLVGGTMTNLFLLRAGVLHTPTLDRCGVAGVARGLVLECAPEVGLRVEQRRIAPDELAAADALFVCNAVVGIWPLREVDGRPQGGVERLADLVRATRARGLP
jgi:4-amino-4-deoxychorismate lyase